MENRIKMNEAAAEPDQTAAILKRMSKTAVQGYHDLIMKQISTLACGFTDAKIHQVFSLLCQVLEVSRVEYMKIIDQVILTKKEEKNAAGNPKVG